MQAQWSQIISDGVFFFVFCLLYFHFLLNFHFLLKHENKNTTLRGCHPNVVRLKRSLLFSVQKGLYRHSIQFYFFMHQNCHAKMVSNPPRSHLFGVKFKSVYQKQKCLVFYKVNFQIKFNLYVIQCRYILKKVDLIFLCKSLRG